MYFSLAQHKNIFVRPQKSNLILAIPLCARTVIFFCDDLTFYHYSLIENKILYQSKLPGRPIQAISLSGHEILCTILQSRALVLLNIQQRIFEQICKLPQTKIHNQTKQKQIFTQTRLHIFQKSNKFYVQQPRIDENKTKIYFYNKSIKQSKKINPEEFVIKQTNTRKMILKKLDSDKRLVLFKQEIDDNGVFRFNTIDCSKDFSIMEHTCENKAFTRFAIVRQIRAISNQKDETDKIIIFVNSNTPQILIYSNNEVRDFGYISKKIFLSTILINVQLGYGMFMFLPDPEQINPNYDHVIELINFKTATVFQRRKTNVNQVVKSWQDDYLLLYKRETNASNSSPFQTENIICKKAFYMKILWQKGFRDFSQNFMGQIMNYLE